MPLPPSIIDSITLPHLHHRNSTLQEVLPHSIQLLCKVDQCHFGGLTALANTNTSTDTIFITVLEYSVKYLIQVQLKKPSRQLMSELLTNKRPSDLSALALFIAINSQIKTQALSQIVQLPVQNQKSLLISLKRLQQKHFKIQTKKQIIQSIQTLQTKNTNIKIDHKQKTKQLEQCQQLLHQIIQQNEIISNQNEVYQKQKQQALKLLDFGDLDSFCKQCCDVKKDVDIYEDAIRQEYQHKESILSNNYKLKKELQNCACIIGKQIQEVQRLKQSYLLLKEQSMLNSQQCCQNGHYSIMEPLKDSTNTLNSITKINESRKVNPNTCRTHNTDKPDPQQSFQQPTTIQFQLQLHLLQQKYHKKTQQLSQQQHDLQSQLKKNKKLQQKINKIKKAHLKYLKMYQQQSY